MASSVTANAVLLSDCTSILLELTVGWKCSRRIGPDPSVKIPRERSRIDILFPDQLDAALIASRQNLGTTEKMRTT